MPQNQPNWAKLVKEGRAKAPGQPWNKKELKARYDHGIPADYVRQGILTPEEYKKAQKKEKEDNAKKIEKETVKENTDEGVTYEDLSWPSLQAIASDRGVKENKKDAIIKALREQDESKDNPFSLSKISDMSTSNLIEKANEELDVELNPAMPRNTIVEKVLRASAKKLSKGDKENNN